MEALTIDKRLAAFRAADAYALEAFRVATSVRTAGSTLLLDALRRTAVQAGAALVAASADAAGSSSERRQLSRARRALIESRYYLYLARRFGLLDLKRYRALTLRQDAALRQLDARLSPATGPIVGQPP
jgi:hypothetical protein